MKIGYACTPIMIPNKTTRKVTLANYSEEKVISLIKNNLEDLYSILVYNKSIGIELFRISSDIIPLGSHSSNQIEWWEIFQPLLINIGKYIMDNNLRVSMHPGQYTLLNSPKEEVVSKSIKDLEYHCKFLDSLKLPSSHKIILHIGGCYDDKGSAMDRFISTYNNLSDSIKSRLVIENDERYFSVYDLFIINQKTSIPIIFDNLHYNCYGEFKSPLNIVLSKVKGTWKKNDGNMKIHYSEQDITKKPGAHAPTTFVNTFSKFLNEFDFSDIDIMLEVKDKDISAIKIVNSLLNTNDKSQLLSQVQKYELFVIEKSGEVGLNKLLQFINDDTIINLYSFIDSLIYIQYEEHFYKLALDKALSIVKEDLNSKELNHFNKYYNEKAYIKCKEYLKKLSTKYNLSLNSTYYFVY